MSTQWEPAKHCHRALTLLLRAVSRRQETANPSATATSNNTTTTAGADQSTSLPGIGEETSASQSHVGPSSTRKRRKLDNSSTSAEQDSENQGVDISGLAGNGAGNNGLGVSGLSGGIAVPGQDGDWDQSLDLDMNMVDLLQEGNFDSLMDLFGQQYPTF